MLITKVIFMLFKASFNTIFNYFIIIWAMRFYEFGVLRFFCKLSWVKNFVSLTLLNPIVLKKWHRKQIIFPFKIISAKHEKNYHVFRVFLNDTRVFKKGPKYGYFFTQKFMETFAVLWRLNMSMQESSWSKSVDRSW